MIIKRDILRALKSRYIQIVFIITVVFSSLFTFFVGNGNKIGISIFGELTTYKDLSEILLKGLDYTKGIGFLMTIAISLFIASEYQYKTWQHYICSGSKRIEIYISRFAFSLVLSLTIFLLYILSSYFTSLFIGKDINLNQVLFVINRGIIVYATLASEVVFISMISKNHLAGIIGSLVFVLFEKDISIMLIKLFERMNVNTKLFCKFTLMKINFLAPIKNINLFSEMVLPCFLIVCLTIILGNYLFSKYEL